MPDNMTKPSTTNRAKPSGLQTEPNRRVYKVAKPNVSIKQEYSSTTIGHSPHPLLTSENVDHNKTQIYQANRNIPPPHSPHPLLECRSL